ncbi:MAG: hypothetical protein DI576_14680 [Actinomyces sp.]|nr:MAG: hypothetical protein DI576_14680 [Actinomyces sp.]
MSGTSRTLRSSNRRAFLRTLLRGTPMARSDVADATGLSTSTVSSIANEPLEDGTLVETGAAARTGARTLLVEQCGYLVGALTAMGVSPMMTFHAGGTQVVRGIPAGVPTRQGRGGDGATQPMTMNLKVYGVDSRALDEFQRLHPDQTYQGDGARVARSARSGISGAYRILAEARSRGDLSYEREAVLAFEGAVPGEFTINMSRIAGLDPTDPLDRSRAEVIGRRQADETVRFLRAHVPGFEHCRLMGTGPSIGVRESRRIRGMHELTARELVTNTMFDDAVSMGGYPIDLHDPDGGSTTHYVSLREGSWYSIPYRSLVPRELGNLIVAGRCLSATQDALTAVRVTPVVMGFSQASGTGAALAVRADAVTDLRTLDTTALRTRLTADGVFLDAYRERRG